MTRALAPFVWLVDLLAKAADAALDCWPDEDES